MYDKYCDTYYLTQGIGRQVSSVVITKNPNLVPKLELTTYEVVRKNNHDYLIDGYGGYVKIEDLVKYQITYIRS